MSAKFNRLAAEVGSKRLAGYITQHNPKVRARAVTTLRQHKNMRRHKKTSLTPRAK